MGASASTNVLSSPLRDSRVEWSVPSWCYGPGKCNLTPQMVAIVQQSWKNVMDEKCNIAFIEAKKKEHSLTPLTFFYNLFYGKLFEWIPEVKPLFKRGMRQQGKMLANLLKYIVQSLDKDQEEFKTNLVLLAKVHNGAGITANHYSIMGMILIQSIRICLGPAFTDDLRVAWTVVYSRMMLVIIPVVVSGELVESDYVDHVTEGKQTPKAKGLWAWRDAQPGDHGDDDEDSKCPVTNQTGKCPANK